MHIHTPPASVLILMATALLSFSAWSQVSLVRDGNARAVIVLPDVPTETARYAADELVHHVERATGVRLDIVSESQTPAEPHSRVFIGDTRAACGNGIDAGKLPREAFVLRSVGNDLFIVGREQEGDPLEHGNPHVGALFGVYDFLERFLGVRWLWPGELGTYVPRTGTVELWAVNETVVPALTFRELVWYRMRSIARGEYTVSGNDARLGFSPDTAHDYALALRTLLRRHRIGGLDIKPPSGHRFHGWWARYGREHPEWFGMRRDGSRGHPEDDFSDVPMCVSNEELHDYIISQWDGGDLLMLGPVDRPGRCNCPNCRAWDGPHPETPPWFAERLYRTDRRSQELFAGATSDRYARFWKTMQKKAAEINPNVLVSVSFLYENEFPAPVTDIRLNSNLYGEFVQWQDPHLRWFPMPEEALDWVKAQWLGWRETGIRMAYRPNYLHDGYVMPHFDTRQSGNFFKFAVEHGMEGARFDSLTGQWATQGLRLYLHLRLMANPALSVEEIRDEYFDAFGPAADAMRRYYDYWEDYAVQNTMRFIELYWDVGWRYRIYVRKAHEAFPPECFTPAEALLDEALARAAVHEHAEYADRVTFIRIGLTHAQLTTRLAALFDGQEAVPEERLEEARDALLELVAFRKAHEHTFFSDLLHVTSFWELPHLDLEALLETP